MQTLVQSPTAVKPSTTRPTLPRTAAIRSAARAIARKHPHLTRMAERAAFVAESRLISYRRPYTLAVESTTGEGEYEIHLDHGRILDCTCPSFQYRPAVINGRSYCKHIMALAILNRIGEAVR